MAVLLLPVHEPTKTIIFLSSYPLPGQFPLDYYVIGDIKISRLENGERVRQN